MAENREFAGYSSDGAVTSETLFTPARLASLSFHLAGIRVDEFLPLFLQLLARSTTYTSTTGGENKAQMAFRIKLKKVRR